jgi:alcohol dehydrogenase class IV
LAHDIGKVLGGKFHIPHGNGCASCLPQVMQIDAAVVPEKVKEITLALGGTVKDNATPEEIGKAAYETILALMKKLKLPSLRDFGVKNGFTKDDLLAVVPENVVMMQEGLVKLFGQGTSPVPASEELIATIVSRAWDEN